MYVVALVSTPPRWPQWSWWSKKKNDETIRLFFLPFNVDCKTIPSAQNETQTYFPQKE